jgi:hypothetical protein
MRPYRWQDPAPAPVAAIRERRTKRVPINCAETAPEQPSMVVDGVEYVEAPETDGCAGCEFRNSCSYEKRIFGEHAFGGGCGERHVIYIRKA